MAIQQLDNFAAYGVGGGAFLLNGVYAEKTDDTGVVADPDPSGTGAPVLHTTGDGNKMGVRYVLSASESTVGVGHRLWMANLPVSTAATPGVIFRDISNANIAGWYVLTTGAIAFWVGTTGNIVAQTSGPVITANAWWHIEVKWVQGTSFELRVEGVPKIVYAGATGSVACAQLVVGGLSVANTIGVYYKDLNIWDGSGALNTTFLGSIVVYSLNTATDITLGGWTLTGAASGSAALATAPPQDGVKYIAAAFPVPAPSSFTLTDLPANVTSIKGLMTYVRASKVDGGDGNLQTSLLSGASTANGVDRPITSAYTYWRDIFETDPATSAPWTVAATNAVNMKINRTV